LFINTLLPSYIPLRPHLPQNHYKVKKTVLLIINELAKNRREKNGRFTRIYHQSCSELGILGELSNAMDLLRFERDAFVMNRRFV